MKGAYFLIMVILLVFAVPLTASPVLGNTVDEVLETSPLKKEVPFTDRVLAYDHIAILNVGVLEQYLKSIETREWAQVVYESLIKGAQSMNNFAKALGGGRRVKLGRH